MNEDMSAPAPHMASASAAMRTVLSTTGSGSHQRRVRSLSSSTVGYASEESLALRPIGMGTPTPTARTVDVSIP